jgi:hypothetical protein
VKAGHKIARKEFIPDNVFEHVANVGAGRRNIGVGVLKGKCPVRARTATSVSKPAVFEIGRFRNWEREIGGGTRCSCLSDDVGITLPCDVVDQIM